MTYTAILSVQNNFRKDDLSVGVVKHVYKNNSYCQNNFKNYSDDTRHGVTTP